MKTTKLSGFNERNDFSLFYNGIIMCHDKVDMS